MRKHISEVELCEYKSYKGICMYDSEQHYHGNDFCLLCGYELEGDRLYMEIHGSNGALNNVKDIDSSQPYACMECAGQFKANRKHFQIGKDLNFLDDFIKEKRK